MSGTRTDLPYLRSRRLRRPADAAPAAPAPAAAPAPQTSASSLDLSAPSAPDPAPSSSSLDLSAPSAPAPSSSPLDLSAPVSPEAPSTGSSLDLGSTDPAAPSTPSGGTSLNLFDDEEPASSGGTSLSLDAPSGAPAPVQTSPRGHARLAEHDLGLPSIRADERRLMTEHEPVVALTRMQSAAGALEAKVAVPNPSEVVLGLVFETSDGRQSLVLPGLSQQGPDPRRPIFRATSSGVAVNLRRIPGVHRLLLFAVPTRPSKQLPGGTVTVTTYGGSRLEAPLVAGPTLGAQALMTAYVVEGRLVIRAEHDPYSGTLQQICAAYGYREISWRDPYTPLV